MYLFPVFMHYSLSRNSANSAIYKTLTKTMNFSKNMCTLMLYSGMISAYLKNNTKLNNN